MNNWMPYYDNQHNTHAWSILISDNNGHYSLAVYNKLYFNK